MNNLIDNRQIRVFISSTFQDMQDERNYLMKRTFPKLRTLAAKRDVTLTEVDLRWGITPEESKSGKVLEICLREIENSIPFFIGILGNRYGWVPKMNDLDGNVTERFADVNKYIEQHLSVTEMEMQFGVLSRKQKMHAHFYIKDFEDNQTQGLEAEPEESLQKLEKLRQTVKGCKKYPSTTYNSIENLAMQVEEDFTALLDQLFPQKNLSELEKERIGQSSFMNQLCQNYIKDDKNFAALDAWLADEDSRQYVVTGASGLGKSALIANWLKEKQNDSECKYNIIYHFTGNGGSESNSEHITRSLINEINDLYGWNHSKADTKLDDLFVKVSAEEDKPLLIVIDAINQIVDADNAKLLNWLPTPTKNIKILYSTLEDDRTMEVFRNRNYPIYTLQPLDIERRTLLVKNYLKLYAKALADKQVERIVTDSKCENTLLLKTLLDELINFGIYEKLDERIEYYLGVDTEVRFYEVLLESLEDTFGKDFVRTVNCLIAVSRHGLSENEVRRIMVDTCKWKDKQLLWSEYFCATHYLYTQKNGMVTFAHTILREAIEKQYLGHRDLMDDYRNKIIDHNAYVNKFELLENVLEFFYQLAERNDDSGWRIIARTIVYQRFFSTLYNNDSQLCYRLFIELSRRGFDMHKCKYECSDPKDSRDLCAWLSITARNINRHKEAYFFAKKQFQYAKQVGGKDEIVVARVAVANAVLNLPYTKKRCNEAKKMLIDAATEKCSREHIAYAWTNFAHFYDKANIPQGLNGRPAGFETAIALNKAALNLNIEAGKDYDVAVVYTNMASCYFDHGEIENAIEHQMKAKKIADEQLGYCPISATIYDNLAYYYHATNRDEEAATALKKCMAINEKVYGNDYPDYQDLQLRLQEYESNKSK